MDNGWPVRPTQTMLDNYIDGAHPSNQSNGTEQQNPPQWNVSWGDQVMNGQNMALLMNAMGPPANREPMPLEYA
jgi:hypothetical protein